MSLLDLPVVCPPFHLANISELGLISNINLQAADLISWLCEYASFFPSYSLKWLCFFLADCEFLGDTYHALFLAPSTQIKFKGLVGNSQRTFYATWQTEDPAWMVELSEVAALA